MYIKLLLFIILFISSEVKLDAQKTEDFFYLETEGYEFPVLVRGNANSDKLILFVQGGPGETAVDFARSDYPRWENTLENEFLIAYYDQRGLNQNVRKIDTSKISYQQYSRDIIAIGQNLRQKYDTDIYVMGHSAGGKMVVHTLKNFPGKISFIKGALVLNTPITTDFSPERWSHFRPLFLKNLALNNIEQDINPEYWQNAYNWITEIDSITTPEQARKWNTYTDAAFTPAKRSITAGMVFSVLFSKPYNPFTYFLSKDNELVSDLLWENERALNFMENLEQIKVPVLLLTGELDSIAPPGENTFTHEHIPNSTLVILKNAGHESFLDQPEQFNKEIIRFISHN